MLINPFDFSSLISPNIPEDFLKNYWENKPFILTNRKAEGYEGLIGIKEVEHLLTTLTSVDQIGNKVPWVSFYRDKKRLPTTEFIEWNDFLGAPLLSKEKVLKSYQEGDSVFLASLQIRSEPVCKLCSELKETFDAIIWAGAFLTPPSAQCLDAHFDHVNVFVLQLEGEKIWKIYDSIASFPMERGNTVDSNTLGDPLYEITLKPGDFLYIPRGWVHEACTSQDCSLHLSIGLQVFSWVDILKEIIMTRPGLRKALPNGTLFQNGIQQIDPQILDILKTACQDSKAIDTAFQKLKHRCKKNPSFQMNLKSPSSIR